MAPCYLAVKQLFEGPLAHYDYEHIFCDNASTDNTALLLKGLAAQDPRVKIIVNARNFGALRSNYNGVLAATGDAVLVFLPADLQDPPEVIPQMVAHWEAGNEIVYGIRASARKAFCSARPGVSSTAWCAASLISTCPWMRANFN